VARTLCGVLGHWRYRGGLAVLVLGVACLAGCGTSSSPASQAEDQVFLAQVHAAAPDVGSYRNDTELERLGHVACDDFRSGVSYQEIATRLPDTEGSHALPPSDLGAVITAAVSAYCPQYHNQVS
jgi:hypothetical protein